MYIEYVGHASRGDLRNSDSLQSLNSLSSRNELLQLRNDIGGNEALGRRPAQANNHPSSMFPAVLGIFLPLLAGLLVLQKQGCSHSREVRQQIPHQILCLSKQSHFRCTEKPQESFAVWRQALNDSWLVAKPRREETGQEQIKAGTAEVCSGLFQKSFA